MANQIHAITMPKLGLTMEEGSVSAWHVEPDAEVKEGDEIADIETEKVTTPYEAPTSGVWRKTIAKVGDSFSVGRLSV